MKKLALLFLIPILFSSCATELQLENHIDNTAPLMLSNIRIGSDQASTMSVEVGSEKWIKFMQWVENNPDGWRSSPASHVGEVYLFQTNFKLIHTKNSNGVVISFQDENGQPKQYYKKIKVDELQFLYLN